VSTAAFLASRRLLLSIDMLHPTCCIDVVLTP
jgi:hypothetical protein